MLIRLENIYKIYGEGLESEVRALDGVSLTIDRGEFVAIAGASGSGKSTMMNVLGCLDIPTYGEYWLDGQNVRELTDKQLSHIRNKQIGFIFQGYNLIPELTALENVELPLLYAGVGNAERRERARSALEMVGLGDRIDHRPDQLSGGQCQRVAIARAMVGGPKLLLADEPTGALDSASGAQVMELFRQLHENGATIIMITHDAQVAQQAQRIMTIRDGVLSGGDNHEQ